MLVVGEGGALQTLGEGSPFSFSHPVPATLTGNYAPWKAPSYSAMSSMEASADHKVALKSAISSAQFPIRTDHWQADGTAYGQINKNKTNVLAYIVQEVCLFEAQVRTSRH